MKEEDKKSWEEAFQDSKKNGFGIRVWIDPDTGKKYFLE